MHVKYYSVIETLLNIQGNTKDHQLHFSTYRVIKGYHLLHETKTKKSKWIIPKVSGLYYDIHLHP